MGEESTGGLGWWFWFGSLMTSRCWLGLLSPEGLTGAGRCDFKVSPSHGCQVTVGCWQVASTPAGTLFFELPHGVLPFLSVVPEPRGSWEVICKPHPRLLEEWRTQTSLGKTLTPLHLLPQILATAGVAPMLIVWALQIDGQLQGQGVS